MKHYSLVIEEKLVKEIDRLIKNHGMFSSRSDFIRDAIRARLLELKKLVLEDSKAAAEEGSEADQPEFAEPMHGTALHPVRDSEHKYRGVH